MKSPINSIASTVGIEHEKLEEFAIAIIKETLDQVAERAWYSGDRAWSDDIDRRWIELHFNFGDIHDKRRV